MALKFPGINSLQIQVTTKDFVSGIHYGTIPLTKDICTHSSQRGHQQSGPLQLWSAGGHRVVWPPRQVHRLHQWAGDRSGHDGSCRVSQVPLHQRGQGVRHQRQLWYQHQVGWYNSSPGQRSEINHLPIWVEIHISWNGIQVLHYEGAGESWGICRWVDRLIVRQFERQTDRQTYRWIHGWMDRWWMDE